jgi:hypothetical protein
MWQRGREGEAWDRCGGRTRIKEGEGRGEREGRGGRGRNEVDSLPAPNFDDFMLYKVASHELKSLSSLVDCCGIYYFRNFSFFKKNNQVYVRPKAPNFLYPGCFFCFFLKLTRKVRGLYFPFMAVIEYLGYRLIAMTCLPIRKKTLKVGTYDQGRHFYFDDEV